MSCGKAGLGDQLESALRTVGITTERVEWWLGQPCGCDERKYRLNQLGSWAAHVLQGNLDKAKEYLDSILRP